MQDCINSLNSKEFQQQHWAQFWTSRTNVQVGKNWPEAMESSTFNKSSEEFRRSRSVYGICTSVYLVFLKVKMDQVSYKQVWRTIFTSSIGYWLINNSPESVSLPTLTYEYLDWALTPPPFPGSTLASKTLHPNKTWCKTWNCLWVYSIPVRFHL